MSNSTYEVASFGMEGDKFDAKVAFEKILFLQVMNANRAYTIGDWNAFTNAVEVLEDTLSAYINPKQRVTHPVTKELSYIEGKYYRDLKKQIDLIHLRLKRVEPKNRKGNDFEISKSIEIARVKLRMLIRVMKSKQFLPYKSIIDGEKQTNEWDNEDIY